MVGTVLTTQTRDTLADALFLIQKKNATIFWHFGTPLRTMGTGLTMIGMLVRTVLAQTKTPSTKSLVATVAKWENFFSPYPKKKSKKA